MKEQVRWDTINGKEITVTVELILSKNIWADGDNFEVKCCNIKVTAEVEGMGAVATSAPHKRDNIPSPDAVAVMGKLALNQEKYDLVVEAIAKVKATPEWQAKIDQGYEADKFDQEYEAHHKKVEKMMSY